MTLSLIRRLHGHIIIFIPSRSTAANMMLRHRILTILCTSLRDSQNLTRRHNRNYPYNIDIIKNTNSTGVLHNRNYITLFLIIMKRHEHQVRQWSEYHVRIWRLEYSHTDDLPHIMHVTEVCSMLSIHTFVRTYGLEPYFLSHRMTTDNDLKWIKIARLLTKISENKRNVLPCFKRSLQSSVGFG